MTKVFCRVFFAILTLYSCDEIKNKEENAQEIQNQIVVTSKGDTLENGFWKYDMGASGVSQSGNYKNGYKTGKWIYKTDTYSISTMWSSINYKDVKFSIPDYFKPINRVEQPVLFQADVEDNDSNTYLVLLRYNLAELNLSVHDYLYQYSESWKINPKETLNSLQFKKFYFKGIEVYRAKVKTKREFMYEAISYIFVIKNSLYDLTYKDEVGKSSAITIEIFNDIFYSMECESIDLFNHNNRKYFKEEDVEFENNNS